MGYSLGLRSKKNLIGVDPNLVKVMRRAIELTDVDFTVIEGLRTEKRQRQLVAQGASKTMKSRHITGHAVDVAPYVDGKVRWDWPLYFPIASAVKKAAEEYNIMIRWGGSWKVLNNGPEPTRATLHKRFPDGPHFEIPA
jgi:peptidoglycan L-alanyl-D-glutamate endopeptidase CwlK